MKQVKILKRVNTKNKSSGLVIGLLKQKSSLHVSMIRSSENQFLQFITFHCYNQPLTKPIRIGWWHPPAPKMVRDNFIFKSPQNNGMHMQLYLFTR